MAVIGTLAHQRADGRRRAERDHDLRVDGSGAALVHPPAHRTSDFLSGYWWLLLVLGGTIYWLRALEEDAEQGKLKWHGFLLKVPVFGKLFSMLAIARFARTLRRCSPPAWRCSRRWTS
jgi:hypothetical protein